MRVHAHNVQRFHCTFITLFFFFFNRTRLLKALSKNSSVFDPVSAPAAIAFTLQPHTWDREETTHTFRRSLTRPWTPLHSETSVYTQQDSQLPETSTCEWAILLAYYILAYCFVTSSYGNETAVGVVLSLESPRWQRTTALVFIVI